MKIICVGQNYQLHNKEMNRPAPAEPLFFLKPDTALLKDNEPFYLPDLGSSIHYELEVVLKICKNGKFIEPEFAGNYFEELTVGIDFTARDLQAECKEKGWPWEKAKAFDHSAPVGKFVHKKKYKDIEDLHFNLALNGTVVQNGHTKEMLFSFNAILAHVSRFITLRQGDLIFTGTPAGVGPVAIGDQLTGQIEGETLIDFRIK